jgi:hypothetical protein
MNILPNSLTLPVVIIVGFKLVPEHCIGVRHVNNEDIWQYNKRIPEQENI